MYDSTFDKPTPDMYHQLATGYSFEHGHYHPSMHEVEIQLLKKITVRNWYLSDPNPSPDRSMKSTAGEL
jgi:hypothetical protein